MVKAAAACEPAALPEQPPGWSTVRVAGIRGRHGLERRAPRHAPRLCSIVDESPAVPLYGTGLPDRVLLRGAPVIVAAAPYAASYRELA